METDETSFTPEQAGRDDTEHTVAALWCEALQLTDPPGPTDNFFALGGDSMTMTMLEFRIGEELAVNLPPGTVLSSPTLRELSAVVAAARNSSATAV
jgi:acyl carrier protein